jgi:hypothetical protein
VQKNTVLFTKESPDSALDEMAGYFEEKGYKYSIDDDKYKIKVEILSEGTKKSE